MKEDIIAFLEKQEEKIRPFAFLLPSEDEVKYWLQIEYKAKELKEPLVIIYNAYLVKINSSENIENELIEDLLFDNKEELADYLVSKNVDLKNYRYTH